jgi:hypothetical protein
MGVKSQFGGLKNLQLLQKIVLQEIAHFSQLLGSMDLWFRPIYPLEEVK